MMTSCLLFHGILCDRPQTGAELCQYKARCGDLEYREEELSQLVNRLRSEAGDQQPDIKERLEDSYKQTKALQDRLHDISEKFDELKNLDKSYISKFEHHITELQAVIGEKDAEIFRLTDTLSNAPVDDIKSSINSIVSQPKTTTNNSVKAKVKKKRKKGKS